MKCGCCGTAMIERETDLPFKIGDTAMQHIEEILQNRTLAVELEVVRFAA